MRLATRLLWPLLSVVAIVMMAYGAYAAARREAQLLADAHRETEAYATALGIALEYAFADREVREVGRILDRISLEPKIYGVIVYDPTGHPLQAAAPLTVEDALPAQRVLALLSVPAGVDRVINGERVFSVLRAIRGPRGVLGALEVVQPLAPIMAEVARTRTRAVGAAVTLAAAVSIVLLWLVRRVVARPLHQLVAGSRALGRGELSYRIEERGSTELTELSSEFNRMAAHLEDAQHGLLEQAEQRVVLERQLRNAEKLAAVGNLAAGLAHEIAAPLNVVAGRAEMLRQGRKPAEARDRDLRIIIDQIGRITVIVRNLLDFARRREPRLQSLPLAPLLRGVLDLLDGEVERAGIRVACQPGEHLVVLGDAQLLHQVFVNVLLNAIHSLEQGTGARHIDINAHAEHDAVGRRVVIDVSDNGPGLAPEIAARLFEPFVTSKPPGSGTGLGLAVVRSIIQDHNGSVSAFDRAQQPGMVRGATFRIVLPAAESTHG